MATLTIYNRTTDMPQEHLDLFYAFPPDDWDYFILGDDEWAVTVVAERLQICDHMVRQFPNGQWIAITYHA